jgi:hypothetical protein
MFIGTNLLRFRDQTMGIISRAVLSRVPRPELIQNEVDISSPEAQTTSVDRTLSAGLLTRCKGQSDERIRASGLGSLCACKSVDPGSRGAMHARVETPFKASYRAHWLFVGAYQMSGAGLPVGPALLSGRSDRELSHGYDSYAPLWFRAKAVSRPANALGRPGMLRTRRPDWVRCSAA